MHIDLCRHQAEHLEQRRDIVDIAVDTLPYPGVLDLDDVRPQIAGDPGDPESNKTMVARFVEEVWNERNLDPIKEIFHPEILGNNPPVSYLYAPHNRETFTQSIADYLAAQSIETVADDIRDVQPTIMFGVPRIWEKIHATALIKLQDATRIKKLFGDDLPYFGSSKSMCGHSLGAAGVNEAIHCLLMMEQGFMAGSANISELDLAAEGLNVLRETREAPVTTAMSNNFGFGGTNAVLVFRAV